MGQKCHGLRMIKRIYCLSPYDVPKIYFIYLIRNQFIFNIFLSHNYFNIPQKCMHKECFTRLVIDYLLHDEEII